MPRGRISSLSVGQAQRRVKRVGRSTSQSEWRATGNLKKLHREGGHRRELTKTFQLFPSIGYNKWVLGSNRKTRLNGGCCRYSDNQDFFLSETGTRGKISHEEGTWNRLSLSLPSVNKRSSSGTGSTSTNVIEDERERENVQSPSEVSRLSREGTP